MLYVHFFFLRTLTTFLCFVYAIQQALTSHAGLRLVGGRVYRKSEVGN